MSVAAICWGWILNRADGPRGLWWLVLLGVLAGLVGCASLEEVTCQLGGCCSVQRSPEELLQKIDRLDPEIRGDFNLRRSDQSAGFRFRGETGNRAVFSFSGDVQSQPGLEYEIYRISPRDGLDLVERNRISSFDEPLLFDTEAADYLLVLKIPEAQIPDDCSRVINGAVQFDLEHRTARCPIEYPTLEALRAEALPLAPRVSATLRLVRAKASGALRFDVPEGTAEIGATLDFDPGDVSGALSLYRWKSGSFRPVFAKKKISDGSSENLPHDEGRYLLVIEAEEPALPECDSEVTAKLSMRRAVVPPCPLGHESLDTLLDGGLRQLSGADSSFETIAVLRRNTLNRGVGFEIATESDLSIRMEPDPLSAILEYRLYRASDRSRLDSGFVNGPTRILHKGAQGPYLLELAAPESVLPDCSREIQVQVTVKTEESIPPCEERRRDAAYWASHASSLTPTVPAHFSLHRGEQSWGSLFRAPDPGRVELGISSISTLSYELYRVRGQNLAFVERGITGGGSISIDNPADSRYLLFLAADPGRFPDCAGRLLVVVTLSLPVSSLPDSCPPEAKEDYQLYQDAPELKPGGAESGSLRRTGINWGARLVPGASGRMVLQLKTDGPPGVDVKYHLLRVDGVDAIGIPRFSPLNIGDLHSDGRSTNVTFDAGPQDRYLLVVEASGLSPADCGTVIPVEATLRRREIGCGEGSRARRKRVEGKLLLNGARAPLPAGVEIRLEASSGGRFEQVKLSPDLAFEGRFEVYLIDRNLDLYYKVAAPGGLFDVAAWSLDKEEACRIMERVEFTLPLDSSRGIEQPVLELRFDPSVLAGSGASYFVRARWNEPWSHGELTASPIHALAGSGGYVELKGGKALPPGRYDLVIEWGDQRNTVGQGRHSLAFWHVPERFRAYPQFGWVGPLLPTFHGSDPNPNATTIAKDYYFQEPVTRQSVLWEKWSDGERAQRMADAILFGFHALHEPPMLSYIPGKEGTAAILARALGYSLDGTGASPLTPEQESALGFLGDMEIRSSHFSTDVLLQKAQCRIRKGLERRHLSIPDWMVCRD